MVVNLCLTNAPGFLLASSDTDCNRSLTKRLSLYSSFLLKASSSLSKSSVLVNALLLVAFIMKTKCKALILSRSILINWICCGFKFENLDSNCKQSLNNSAILSAKICPAWPCIMICAPPLVHNCDDNDRKIRIWQRM